MATMQLKAFHAKTMAQALLAVKNDLGPDAVIVRTRSFKIGGVLGLGSRPMVEIVATAAPEQPRTLRSMPSAPRPALRDAKGSRHSGAAKAAVLRAAAQAYSPASITTPAANPTLVQGPPPERTRAEVLPVRKRRSVGVGRLPMASAPPAEPGATATAQARNPGSIPSPRMAPRPDVLPAPFVEMHRCATPALSADPAPTIEEELAAIKRMVGQVIQSSIPGVGPGGMPDALFKHYLRLLEQEVARDLAERVVGAVRNELTAVQLQSDSAVSQAVLRHLAAMIPVAESVVAPGRAADGRPYTVALVGPTGVGKTTTIAKLAAAYQLRHGRKVGLITCDTYRIAAVDQLRTYAEIIGVPLKVVMTAEEMGAACRAFADCDAILIDTAGRSPQDGARLEELGRFIEAAAPHETHLVLSGAAGERGMINAAERFAVVSPNRVIFTKLDEAVNYGVLLNVAGRLRTMLSFVTMGQEVPEHIEEGRADHLARLVLEGGVYR